MLVCHSLWGVWVEIYLTLYTKNHALRHSLWGVWVEIILPDGFLRNPQVTPFGECGLKFVHG